MSVCLWHNVLLQKRFVAKPAIGKSIVVWNAWLAPSGLHSKNNRFWKFVSLQQHKCMSILFPLQKEWLPLDKPCTRLYDPLPVTFSIATRFDEETKRKFLLLWQRCGGGVRFLRDTRLVVATLVCLWLLFHHPCLWSSQGTDLYNWSFQHMLCQDLQPSKPPITHDCKKCVLIRDVFDWWCRWWTSGR